MSKVPDYLICGFNIKNAQRKTRSIFCFDIVNPFVQYYLIICLFRNIVYIVLRQKLIIRHAANCRVKDLHTTGLVFLQVLRLKSPYDLGDGNVHFTKAGALPEIHTTVKKYQHLMWNCGNGLLFN